jgi:hypothetical protein
MKKIIIVFIASFALALTLFFAVQYYLGVNAQKGALQVTSAPDSKVYLNDKYLGQTPLCKCEAADMLASGEYTIRLVPLDTSLREFQEKVTISPAVLTVVDRKFGKNGLSEGSIISLTPLSEKEKTELLVASFPQSSEVLLDDTIIGITPLSHKDPTESDHVLKIRKEGYNDKEVRIRTPRGYKLTVTAYLSTNGDPQQSASTAATPVPEGSSPTPTPVQERVTISDTPTGFLRVRATPSTTGAEVGRVSPGQTYPLSSEQAGWFEITLEDGTKGWVSSEYASK